MSGSGSTRMETVGVFVFMLDVRSPQFKMISVKGRPKAFEELAWNHKNPFRSQCLSGLKTITVHPLDSALE